MRNARRPLKEEWTGPGLQVRCAKLIVASQPQFHGALIRSIRSRGSQDTGQEATGDAGKFGNHARGLPSTQVIGPQKVAGF